MEIYTFTNIVIVVIGLVLGFIISKLLEKTSITKTLDNAKTEATRILKSAESDG